MRYVILSMLITSFIISNIYSIDTTSTKYFPLKIGNKWVYTYYSPWPPPGITYRYRSEITRDTIINGHKYFYITNAQHIFPAQTPFWYRVDSADGKLITFGINICSNYNYQVIDSLSSSVNDSVRICPNGFLRKCISILNQIVIGINTTTKKFDWPPGPAAQLRYFSKYIGLTSAAYGELFPQSYTINGCVLNGVLYGDTNLLGINKISSEIPFVYSLSQNYPNPFNPSTKIRFDIPPLEGVRGRIVKLVIYDVLGREVTTLINEQLKPCTYEIEWDASNYPSGVYFYKMETAVYSETKKMILIN